MPCETYRSVVLIIDELELRRAGFASVVELWARAEDLDIDAIAPAEIEAFAARQRDVKLIILSVGGTSLEEPQIRESAARIAALFPGKPCSVISDRTEAEEAVMAAKLCVQAFLSTNMDADVACQAFTFILGGGTYFPREALLQSASINGQPKRSAPAQDGDQGGLTRRQVEVLEKLRLGKSNKLIARDLKMQESTVKVHVRQIMRKLGAANRTQAALLATSVAITHRQSRANELTPAGQSLVNQEVAV
jgi:DNA-binding NarL/FixJ family response regulator